MTALQFRTVTPEEIAFYQQHGWVKLEQFLPRPQVDALLAMAKERMGEAGDRNTPPEFFSYFNPLPTNGMNDDMLRPIILEVGRNARLLMNRRANVGVRYFTDNFAVKLPAQSKKPGMGGAGITAWHQDYTASGCDRAGGMVFWMALADLTPEMGTMCFLSGSHRHGPMGHYLAYGDGDLLSAYPELPELYPNSGQVTYRAGDVTVHNNLIAHSASENHSTLPRWAYAIIVSPADACWNGAPVDAFSTEGLTLHREMTDAKAPVIG